MSIAIVSKTEGFRRCGIPHPASMVEYPDGRFTPDEILRLQAEPMLEIEIIEGKEPASIESSEPKKPKKSTKKKQGGKIK